MNLIFSAASKRRRNQQGGFVVLVLILLAAGGLTYVGIKAWEWWQCHPPKTQMERMNNHQGSSMPVLSTNMTQVTMTKVGHWWVYRDDESLSPLDDPKAAWFRIPDGVDSSWMDNVEEDETLEDFQARYRSLVWFGAGFGFDSGSFDFEPTIGSPYAQTLTSTNSSPWRTNVVKVFATTNEVISCSWTDISQWVMLDTSSMRDTNGYPLEFVSEPIVTGTPVHLYRRPVDGTNWTALAPFNANTNHQYFIDIVQGVGYLYRVLP